MRSLKPWAYGPLELIVNAERHYRKGEDFDRRVALIGYDNSIEVSITTYLSLKPLQRAMREYKRDDCAKWLASFPSKLDFFEQECQRRGVGMACGKDELLWYHELRNGQYHGGGATVPQARELEGIRRGSIDVFSTLYDEPDAEALVQEYYDEMNPKKLPDRSSDFDRLIDSRFGLIEIAGKDYYTSEALYSCDPVAYSELGSELASARVDASGDQQ